MKIKTKIFSVSPVSNKFVKTTRSWIEEQKKSYVKHVQKKAKTIS